LGRLNCFNPFIKAPPNPFGEATTKIRSKNSKTVTTEIYSGKDTDFLYFPFSFRKSQTPSCNQHQIISGAIEKLYAIVAIILLWILMAGITLLFLWIS